MKKILCLSVFLLSGCSAMGPNVQFLYQSSSGPVYEAKCDGSAYSIGTCYQLAGNTCNGNFQIMDKSQKNERTYMYKNLGEYPAKYDTFATTKRSLIFYCK